MAKLLQLPRDFQGRTLPAQGTWVRAQNGEKGRFVGLTRSGLVWVWHERMARGSHPVSFETMCERFKEKRAPEVVQIRISPKASENLASELSQWGPRTVSKVELGASFVRGPRHLMERLGKQIETLAWEQGRQGKIPSVTAVARVCLGRKLRGGKPIRSQVQSEFRQISL